MTGENQQARLGAAWLPPVRAEPRSSPRFGKPTAAGGWKAASNTDLSRGHSESIFFSFCFVLGDRGDGKDRGAATAIRIRGLSAPCIAAQLSSVQARLHGTALCGSREHRPGL